MAQKNINIGSGELVGDGESIRSAFDKINQNFVELYAGAGTAEANDLTQAVVWANVPDTNITESSVTQHQAAISITESQISDLQNYLTSYTETNDLTSAVTWTNVPDINITQSSVTQHQAALTITQSQISDLTHYTDSDVDTHLNTSTAVAEQILSWDGADYSWISQEEVDVLGSFSVTAPNAAFGSGGLDYNSTNGQFTYTPPDLSNFLTAETDTFQTVTTRGNTTTNEVELNGGVKTNIVQSTNGVHSIGFNEAQPLTIGSTGGVKIIGAAAGTVELGTETSGTVTIGSSSNNVDFSSGTTVDFTGTTVTGLNVTGDITGSVFGDDSTLLVDGVNNTIPKANIQDSTNWDTAFGWGDHSVAGYLTSETTTTLAINANILKYTDETGAETDIDLSLYLDDTNLARLTSGTLDGPSGIATFTRDDSTTFTVDFSDLINTAEANDLTAAVVWADVPDANITESSVTQHQAALSITESQISDFGTYLTSVAFSDLTTTPTTIAGYGITDALELGTTSTTALAGDTALFDGAFSSLSGTPTTLAGYGITDAATSAQGALADSALQSYTETNDLSTAVTWANVPDANITQSSVTQHQAALSITESQISDLQAYLTSYTETDPIFSAHTTSNITNGTGFLKNNGSGTWSYDNSTYLTTETSHADVLVDGDFATAGFMKTDGAGNYTVDNSTYLTSYTETNDLSTAVTWANVPDANITQSSVTQHQAALSITESQISDLQSYLTAETNDLTASVTWANVPDANITQSSVTQHQAALSITESQISDLGSYLTDLTGSSVGTLSDVDFNSVTLDASNGQDKVLAWDQTAQAFVPVDQTNTNTTTFGLAGNTGTHTFDMVSETLTFLGATNQIDIEVATNFISVNLASVVDADIKGSVFADDSSLLVNGVDGTLAYTATTPTDWNGTAPTTVGEAIDRLAALVKTLNGGTGA